MKKPVNPAKVATTPRAAKAARAAKTATKVVAVTYGNVRKLDGLHEMDGVYLVSCGHEGKHYTDADLARIAAQFQQAFDHGNAVIAMPADVTCSRIR